MPLASAVVLELRRGLARRLARRRRWLAAAALAATAPLACIELGRLVARSLQPALADAATARALVTGLTASSLAAGVALGATTSGLAALGDQLAAAASSRLDRIAAALASPAAVVTPAAVLCVLPACAPVLAAAPGGARLLPALGLHLGAACVVGAAAVATVGGSRLVAGAGAVAVAILFAGLVTSGLRLSSAVAGREDALVPTVGGSMVLVAGVWCWGIVLTAGRGERRRARGVSRLPGARALVPMAACLMLLVRRPDLRVALGGAAAIGATGVVLGHLSAASPGAGALLGISAAALAAAPCGLAVAATAREGSHVWSLAPQRSLVCASWVVASGVLTLAPALLAGSLAAALAGSVRQALPVALSLAGGAWGAAVLAGALVSWPATGAADQAVPLAAFVATCGAVIGVSALLGPRLTAAGAPAPAVAVGLLALLVGSAVAALALALGREA